METDDSSTLGDPASTSVPSQPILGKLQRTMIPQTSRWKRQHAVTKAKRKPGLGSALPIRMTSCIFRRPVTKITSHPENVVRRKRSEENLEKPQQLYWYRRLEGLHAYSSSGEPLSALDFPNALGIIVPGCLAEPLGCAVDGNLHTRSEPTLGGSAGGMPPGPGGLSEPLIRQKVTYDDVRKQARKVKKARERLAKALKADRLAREAERMRSPEEKS
ncbi:methyl-CpG-binding domain protein 3-like 2B [Tamandua tetradactyla]|uniref:methyl-CpG-binding domain protein 3-like 2B n=1 Tax=Tamandua tetradactyla TaxID=48850 RepID=UPI004053B83D